MGSEGRSWSGSAAVGGEAEGKPAMAVVAPAPGDVPASDASRYLQGIGERVVISGQLELFDREVLKVTAEDGEGNKSSVTVRLYGPNTDLVIDRKRELQAIPHLSAAGFGAQLLGTFENGMVQSFINARTLTAPDMKEPKIAAEIAKQLNRFHRVEIPGSKEPQLWDDIFKFLKKASILEFEDKETQKRYEEISFREIQDEVKELKDLSDLLHAPVVFSHNDLLSGNLMLNDFEEKLYFIDFEYGSYSYRGYDIANHFNEYAGYDCDYSLYPDKDSQYHFFRNYLQPDRPSEVQMRDLDALFVETNTYRLASHIYWALWALIQEARIAR
uniref:ethanolamine kinase n=1 Tax=Leersia perrieri TaxID=77586 RepID=A0A0D9XE38_9ORYZ